MALVSVLLVCLVSFLLGSIPFGLIVSRLLYGKDIREYGSGNIGSTNALRTLGKKAGGIVFALDCLKGLLAAALSLACLHFWYSFPSYALPLLFPKIPAGAALDASLVLTLTLLSACAGHIFSPWLSWKGGKGVAVALGCLLLVFGPILALFELAIFGIVAAKTRMVSLASLTSVLICPLIALVIFWGHWSSILACFMVTILIFWAHRSNIKRLLNKEESKL